MSMRKPDRNESIKHYQLDDLRITCSNWLDWVPVCSKKALDLNITVLSKTEVKMQTDRPNCALKHSSYIK